MDPHQQFCHNQGCRAYGLKAEGHIVIHSRKERRYQCKRCKRTFSETKGTALYRLHKPKELLLTVVTLLAYGCPLQAICAAFDLDERTVACWQREAGVHCWRVHEHVVEAARVELGQVQADELRVEGSRRGHVVGWSTGGRKPTMVGRSGEHETGPRPDSRAAFSGAQLRLGASGAFMYRWTGQLSQSGHPPLQGAASHW